MASDSVLMRLSEAVRYSGLSRDTLLGLHKEGLIRGRQINASGRKKRGHWYLCRADVERYVERFVETPQQSNERRSRAASGRALGRYLRSN